MIRTKLLLKNPGWNPVKTINPSKIFSILLFVFICSIQSFAMQTTGRIQGNIKDSTGAVVPEGSVTLKNVKTGAERQTQTDEVGRYSFLQVEAGEYQISVENTGFKKYVQVGIILQLNQVAEAADRYPVDLANHIQCGL